MKCLSFPFLMIFANVILSTVLLFLPVPIGLAAEHGLDTAKIESITGLKGVLNEKENTFKVSKPRNDVGNTMGVNTWAAFAGTADDALVVGDFVILENELQTVLKTLRGNGINIVAIHQHMIGENPRMIFLHYYGRGKAIALAEGVKSAISTESIAANQ